MVEEDANARVGRYIADLRKSEGVSQEALGKRVGGVSQTTVSEWENGDRRIPVGKVYRICEEFDVPLSRIMPDLHDGTPTPDQIANALERVAAWARGEGELDGSETVPGDWRLSPGDHPEGPDVKRDATSGE